MPQPPTSPLSPLQSLDLNRNDRRRPSYPGPQWSKKGTNPSDLIKAEGFPYAPSAPLLSIEKDSAAAARQMHVRPVPAHDIRHPGPSSFSPSSCSSYGSYIGSHLYGKAAQTDWHPTQGGTNKFTPISGHERRNITDENDSSASSRLALSPSQHVGTRLSPAAPSMQRQLSLRSNDGFLFQAEEDLDPTHSENNTTALFTPVEPSRGAAHQFTIVPRPFAMPLHDHEGNGAVMPRRDSREKTTTTLKLESPWKSPGWKLREEGRPGSTGRDRSGSCLGMSQLEGEVPALSQRLSEFYISKRRLSTSPKHPRPVVSGTADTRNIIPSSPSTTSPNVKKSRLNDRSTSIKSSGIDGLPPLHSSSDVAHLHSFSLRSPPTTYAAISPLSPTFQHTNSTLGSAGPATTAATGGPPSSSGLPSRRYVAQPRALRLSINDNHHAGKQRIESSRPSSSAREVTTCTPVRERIHAATGGSGLRGVLASPFGPRFHDQSGGNMAMESSPQREMPLSMFGPGGRRGTLNQDSIEEEAHMGEDEAEVVDGDVQSSVKRRIRRWAMDTMQQRADDLSTESTSFLDGMDAQMGLTARTSSDSPDESLHPPDLSSHPSGETVNTITTDSSGAMLMGIESSPTPLHGVKRELVAYPRPTQQGQIGLGIFAPKEETQECSLIQQLKRGKRNMVVQVLQGDPTSKDLGKSPTPAPSLSRFSFSKSHSSPIVPTLNSISFGSGSGEDDRMRKPSLTESTTSSIWQNTLPTRGTLDENDTHSRKTSSKLSFSSIKGLTKKASPLLEYRPQFTPPPVRPTISPQLNGPDGPPSPFEASSESTNSRCNSFLRELQASTSRPPIARRTTAPAKSSPKESNDLPPLPANASSNVLGHMQSQLPHQLVGTPVHVFDSERPSPAAFMSTGLIKKGSGFNSKRAGSEHSLPSSAVNSSGSLSNAFERTKATNMLVDSPLHSAPDTPIKYPVHHGSNPLVSSHKQCLPPLKFGNNASTAPIKPTSLGICTNPSPESDDAESKDDQSSLPTGESNGTISGNSIRFPVGASRGLRRKGSAMWARTNSGNWSNGSWSRQTSILVDEDEPLTPTRNDDRAVVKLDFSTITPSPPAPNARHYPFASSSNLPKIEIANSPTSPLKKSGILARLPKHRALARVSNPLLSAAYKLGEQQANLRAMTFVTPSADSKHKLKIARRLSTSSLGGSDSRFERDFVMLGPIGVGEFSTVWKVREKRNGTVWAVKRGKPYVGEKDRTRQLEEVAILSTLAAVPHPNILQFQEAWEEKRQLHIRTALADCGDFATYVQSISDDGGLDEGRSWKVLHELSEGLRHIHSLGILHLDLKPANILIDQSGMLQISDFGLSIRLASLTPDGYPVVPEGDVFNVREGDREYLSPEMLEGVYGTFSDVFSLGATMLEVAFNIVLPSNGDAWQKLRNNDFSDLEEHCGPFSLGPQLDFHSSLATSITSSCTLASIEASQEKIGNVSFALFSVIRRMMNSDHTRRLTLRQVLSSAPIARLRSSTNTSNPAARFSVESRTRSSVDEWEEWSRQRARDNELSPETTKVESHFIETIDGVRLHGPAKPALVQEDPGFLDKLLA